MRPSSDTEVNRLDAAPNPARGHRGPRRAALAAACAAVVALAVLVAVVARTPRERRPDASALRHSAPELMVAVDEYLDPREAKELSEVGENPLDLLVGISMLSEVRYCEGTEEAATYYDSPGAALAAARATHGESSLYQSMSEPLFVFEGPPYGGNRTAVAVCLAAGESDGDWLAFAFLDQRGERYSNPLYLESTPANFDVVPQHRSQPLAYASEEEKAAEMIFDYLGGDKNLFVANGKVPVYVGCSTNPAVLGITVLGRPPDETATCELGGTVYHLWAYRTFDFNRYLIDSGFNLDEFYLPDLVRALEISVPD